MNYQTVHTVTPAEGTVDPWSLDGQLIPNPLTFAAYTTDDFDGVVSHSVMNQQVTGEQLYEKVASYITSFTRWRLAYASVTIYQDGPDLANQGTVAICQKPVKPWIFTPSSQNPKDAGINRAFQMQFEDMPHFDSTQAMPNSYFGKSKEGAYIPLKLTRTCQKWHSVPDMLYQAQSSSRSPFTGPGANITGGQMTIPTSAENFTTGLYPFTHAGDLHNYTDGVQDALVGTLQPDFCNDVWADFSFRNMAPTTSLSFFFRFGFEVQVQPTSMLSPHLKLSPPHDELAIQTYFAICRELKDAYPADYNDAGKIWGVISSIAKGVAPFLSAIPLVGPALSLAVPAISAGGDMIADAVARAKQGKASQADLENIRLAIPAPPPMPQRQNQSELARMINRQISQLKKPTNGSRPRFPAPRQNRVAQRR